MAVYKVYAQETVTVTLEVEANSEREALEKARRGEYDAVDSEPGEREHPSKWKVSKCSDRGL